MQHVGEVISRERLLSEVWGYDFDPRSNVVDVCVRRLRRRLGPTPRSRPFAMRAIAQLPDAVVFVAAPAYDVRSFRRYRVELLWAAFAAANYAAMIAWPGWETIPFHFVWISLTLLYGFRVWPMRATLIVLGFVVAFTGARSCSTPSRASSCGASCSRSR